MHRQFEHLPQTLQPKVAEYAATTAKKAENICRRNNIAKETAAAIVADAMDVLAGTFHGLHATYPQMQEVTQKTKRSSWEREAMPIALPVVTDYYAQIVDAVENNKGVGSSYIYAAVAIGVKVQKGQEPTAQDIIKAKMLYYILCLLSVGEETNATKEELQGIPTGGVITEVIRQRCIATALEMQRQRREIDATAAKRRKRTPYHEDNNGTLYSVPTSAIIDRRGSVGRVVSNPNKTIKQFQNINYILGGELQTAPVVREGATPALRPLRTAIAERIATAKQLEEQAKTDRHITPQDVQRAQNLITNSESIYHAIDGLHIMTQEMRPTSQSDIATGYTITPHRFAQLATGQENPHQTQVLNIMRALDFLSMERIEVIEEVVKYYPVKAQDGSMVRGEDGRIKKEPKQIKIYTRFTPANTTFYGQFGEEVPLSEAFTMNVQVHRMITKGRSEQYKEVVLENGKKQKLLVQKPRENYLKIAQIYMMNSEAGSRFRNILLSKPKMAQDTLLAAVFDYGGKLREAQAKAKQLQSEYEELLNNPNTTEEQKAEALKKAKDAATNATARRIASKHKDRDIQTLRDMFEKAQDGGIIQSYFARPAAGAMRKANGEYNAVVWEWLRPTKQGGTDTE